MSETELDADPVVVTDPEDVTDIIEDIESKLLSNRDERDRQILVHLERALAHPADMGIAMLGDVAKAIDIGLRTVQDLDSVPEDVPQFTWRKTMDRWVMRPERNASHLVGSGEDTAQAGGYHREISLEVGHDYVDMIHTGHGILRMPVRNQQDRTIVLTEGDRLSKILSNVHNEPGRVRTVILSALSDEIQNYTDAPREHIFTSKRHNGEGIVRLLIAPNSVKDRMDLSFNIGMENTVHTTHVESQLIVTLRAVPVKDGGMTRQYSSLEWYLRHRFSVVTATETTTETTGA